MNNGLEKYNSLEKELKKYGVNVLRNEHVGIRKGEQEINLLGIDDQSLVLETVMKEIL